MKPLALGVLVTGILTFLASTFRLASAPVRYDEAEFTEMAMATARHGTPRIPPAEDYRLLIPPHPVDLKYDQRYGMWHPPMYMYTLAAAGKVLGFHDVVVRLVGVGCLALSLALLWVLARQVGAGPLAFLMLVGLFGLTPLLREGALYIDIDNTALTTLMLLFFVVFIRYEDRLDAKAIAVLSLALGLTLWAKMTSPVMMLAACGIYQLIRKGFKFAVFQLGALTIGGLVLFGLTYFPYCAAFHYPWQYMFEFTFGKTEQIAGRQGLRQMLSSVMWHLVWITPVVSAAIIVALFARAIQYLRERRVQRIDLFVWFFLFGTGAYVVHAGVGGKYMFPFVLAGLLIVAWQLDRTVSSATFRQPILIAVVLVVLGVASAWFVPNLQYMPPKSLFSPPARLPILKDPRIIAPCIAMGVAFVAGIGGLLGLGGTSIFSRFAAGLIAAAVVLNPIDAWKGFFPGDGRAPLRPMREQGYLAVVEYLAHRCKRGDLIMSEKDVGMRLDRTVPVKYIVLEWAMKFDVVRPTLIEKQPRFLVFSTYGQPEWFDAAALPHFASRTTIGDFEIDEFDASLLK